MVPKWAERKRREILAQQFPTPSGLWRARDAYGASSLATKVIQMKVAAYQCPLLGPLLGPLSGSVVGLAAGGAVDLICERVRWSEANGVEILCCPEAVLGGLADY